LSFIETQSEYQGQYKSALTCLTCRYSSKSFSPFMFLSLPLPAHAPHASLIQCLRSFTSTELVSGDDCWFCPQCQQRREATKTMQLWRMPPILLVQLKRFSMNGPFWDKLQTKVSWGN
jgi:ubiquitin carboxyl-terminal hydrolase 8